ncbi:hypothetical protein SAMN05444397_101891 [Flavobacterium aquidurense]|uniref:Uncharacterized protein n=1 Tax=Flavobacterium frigidimaris TaxID=262320 RepID=A0ABX4BVX6_FLAFR|nr:hypothetical protein [Flavobacterium frigidimaris]OXA82074.1 hypothetical protein B0A65_01560 [Flavobacterium frigidimaris]SDY54144.1 hypothetical protein SAMN05444397_101891 [Flavobacterium aquidurense]
MIFYLLFQILVSWLVACCIIRIFNKALSTPAIKFYQEPALLTSILSANAIDLSLKTKLRIGKVLHHTFGLCFAAIYYLIWYCEFDEISWTTSIIIGFISALIRIISWTFLLEIIPAVHTANFKGYYLQLVFIHNIFIIAAFSVDWLL